MQRRGSDALNAEVKFYFNDKRQKPADCALVVARTDVGNIKVLRRKTIAEGQKGASK